MPVTIYDVAKAAGVSTATVSKVLSNTPYVSARTRARVLDVVQRLDFVPNIAARGLSRARTFIVGLVFPYAPDDLFNDPHLMTFMLGVERVAAEHDYNLLLATARPGDDLAGGLHRLLRNQYVDGAVVVGRQSIQSIVDELRYRIFPTVTLGYHSSMGEGNTIHADDRLGGSLAAEHLLELGHRRIGLISGSEDITAVTERVSGFTATLAAAGVPLEPGRVNAGDFTFASGYAAAAALLASPDRPEAIFAVNDRMALGCIAYAQQNGVTVPDELSIVGFDDIQDARFAAPPLTTVRQPSLEMGRLAAQRVFDLLDQGTNDVTPIVLPVELVVRGSTRAVRA